MKTSVVENNYTRAVSLTEYSGKLNSMEYPFVVGVIINGFCCAIIGAAAQSNNNMYVDRVFIVVCLFFD